MIISERYRVSGIVQGVGFRYHTRKQAISIGLTGWVRNLNNGDVELVARGSRMQLDQLYAWLQTGPRLACVDSVEVEAEAVTTPEDYSCFSIR